MKPQPLCKKRISGEVNLNPKKYTNEEISLAVEWLHNQISDREFKEGLVKGNKPLISVKYVHDVIDDAFGEALK